MRIGDQPTGDGFSTDAKRLGRAEVQDTPLKGDGEGVGVAVPGGEAVQVTSDSASAGFAATARRASSATASSRTRNRSTSPVRAHMLGSGSSMRSNTNPT
ncbi:hypothetical protein ACIBG8_47650 [Nonomuraea sp. NPDC050556]|uniref:hypothetical protein n=1 Tax=Nonomuraea sp. NPDC050556 TaxID=3364369 RepID=UPI0037A51B80